MGNYKQLPLPLDFTLADYTRTEQITADAERHIIQETYSYNRERGARWFFNLLTFSYRLSLAHTGNNFHKVTITQQRTGVLITFIRENASKQKEVASAWIPWDNKDPNVVRDAFHHSKLQWKHSKYQ